MDSHEYYVKLKCNFLREAVGSLNSVVLDVGCGEGIAERMLGVPHVVGLDVSRKAIKEAHKKNPENHFVVGSSLNLPFKPQTFDICFCFCMIHHLPRKDHAQSVKEMVNVTKKGGAVACFEHNPLNPVTRMKVKFCPIDTDVELLTRNTMKQLYARNKLTITKEASIVFFPPNLSRFYWLEKHLRPLPFGGQYAVVGAVP